VPELANSAQHFRSVTFSPDGKLMSAVAGGALYLLDAFNGNVTLRLSIGPDSTACEASFSPDGQYVSAGERCSAAPGVVDHLCT
jgi:WD40 repeat protein